MSVLNWNEPAKKKYETGVKKAVLYLPNDEGVYDKGVAWVGITGVNESPSGAEETKLYADDSKYMGLTSAEEFGATVTAYQTPEEFDECDGTAEIADGVSIGQQERKPFGMSYRTIIGNAAKKNNYGYKIHIIYGATAKPSPKDYKSVNESPEAMELSYELTTTPVEVPGKNPTATLTIDSTKVDATKLKALEDILYGTESTEARLPLPEEIITLMTATQAAG